ncbi:carbon-nitrogen family hydrolase [Amycolatopsis granulosa]|uniref:carbon-nitrogen family hydrolase n=1 Tax=Amycolatopsis granulosa TaxID=185684 RepID=UPI001422D637|nr:carbon-nitrogen family hydrolase [Amycolatopsis granulosa]NIH83273.1 putative amidohydrolase [Amycolatopsis granulosa]
MRIAMVQLASPPEESPEDRRVRAGSLVAQARGADLVVLPELWAAGYFAFDRYPERAEPLEGPTVAVAREWARALGAFVHLGSIIERDQHGRLANTAVLLAPDGTIAHTYRKIHVFGYASREAELLTPGDRLEIAETPFGRFGATTCYDLRFPELWRGLVDRGAQTVVVPAAWPAARREHWRLFTTCRAVEEQVLVVAVNAAGRQDGGVELGGHSRVVDPWGKVLAEAGADEEVLCCDVDPAVVDRVRAEFPVLADRRWPLAGVR